MFHVGQKVVAIDGDGTLIKDKIYTVIEIFNCCSAALNVGTGFPRGGLSCHCPRCMTSVSSSAMFYHSKHFVPLSEYTANEAAVDEMVKESEKNIYQK